MVFKNISAIYSLLLPALQFEPGHYTLILRHMNSNHKIIFSDCNSLMLCLSHPLTPTDVILSQIHIDTCYCKSQAAPVCPHLSSYLWLAITKICLSFMLETMSPDTVIVRKRPSRTHTSPRTTEPSQRNLKKQAPCQVLRPTCPIIYWSEHRICQDQTSDSWWGSQTLGLWNL